ncbi:sulfotransferase family 2 domain-containing protein [Lutibaculum baratangense]|uniref:Sulfotransferase family protein n=1 Tax=Lutibaculum baratangense AMV1 TaxID=631454 RepID=V4RD69_9HYPH|nr:sulfotransferase family 2 domain-containing protein [Lutibaculum baratangense]ESR23334.1 hypothetical protein N177_3402 [Lutibaculum baratangense AMV1]
MLRPEITAARQLLAGERAEEAISALRSLLRREHDAQAWYHLARCYVVAGEEERARAILRNIWRRLPSVHVVDLVTAGVPVGMAHAFDDMRLLYFAVPKCASSTVKDAFLVARGERPAGERSHRRTSRHARPVPFADLKTRYSDHTSFTVIRHPRERLRSYWRKNVSEARSLMRESQGKDVFYGLSTSPSYDEIIADFHRYRAVFRDFRHHTDTLVGFLGREPGRIDRIFRMEELDEALALVAGRGGVEIPPLRNMRSQGEALEIGRAT